MGVKSGWAWDSSETTLFGPHPIPRQLLPALPYLLHPCSRLPQGEGEQERIYWFSDGVNFARCRYQRQTRDDAVGVEAVRAGIR